MSHEKPIDRIVDQILNALEEGIRPWRKPWDTGGADGAGVQLALRADGQPFGGMNAIILMMAGASAGHASPYWLTYAQARRAGGQVRRGERSMPAILYKTRIVDDGDDDEDPRVLRYLKCYPVFSADQCDGLPDAYFPLVTDRPESAPADTALDAFPVDVRHGGDRAFYHPRGDFVQLPLPEAFMSPEHYLSTKGHEFVHATGHPKRLDRNFDSKRWGDEGYAIEELVAELGTVLLCARFALSPDHFHSHVDYIGHWAEAIRTYPNALLSAASHADRAVNYILAFSIGKGLVSPDMATRGNMVAE
jgi:antirestriction protein ArdC